MSDTHNRLIEENVRERRFQADQNFEGWRLDEYLANRIGGMSPELATRVADEGDVVVDGSSDVGADTMIDDGTVVVVREHLEPEYVQDGDVETLYEDEAVLVLDKPPGMLIHETASVRLNTITHYLHRRGLDGAEPAHRLDADTSGALVCARCHDQVAALRGLFKEGDPTKVYRVLVVDPEQRWETGTETTLDTPLGIDDESRLPHRMGRGEQRAVTHVEVLGRQAHPMGELADLKVAIETGRQHQIRVHLALEDTPVAGDKMYGRSDQFFIDLCDRPEDDELLSALHFERHALHARRIELSHPVDDRRLLVEAPLPDLWEQ